MSFELAEHAAEETLSPLEVRVLRLIADAHNNKETAAILKLGERPSGTSSPKLGANDRTQAAMIGVSAA